ncbi:4-hydroxyphenylacetate catabolism regulatory protein HpaA [Pseudomonas syringae]|uniref:4-hydroxyphenylacetate catabolism regulatory protein HpaA n=1 Tax=Pseudomonas syringae TaxID=317 RepID=UPI00215B2058|nr:4-hydroxyphenylacetate catabolism regulatory protein HpaA [Pseudomonas syringae]MCR8718345.1 4-hydroxyphenylacetate catabolism regulatory protein HpaA [Pseudomonas syringae]
MSDKAPIPNINIGQAYDQRYSDADIHYDRLSSLAGFFGRNMPVHRHDRFFQMHYVKNGVVRVFLDDQQFVEEGPMFFLTPPTIPHSFVTDAESEGHVLTIRQQIVWKLIETDGSLAPASPMAPVCVALDKLGVEFKAEAARLKTMLDELGREFDMVGQGRVPALLAITQLVLIGLFRLADQSLHARAGRNDDLKIFHRFNALIEERYKEHLSLATYASEMGVSEARLNDVCRRVAGLPSKRLVLERLMQEAKRLLMFTNNSGNEICYWLGFKDPAYFSRFFQRYAHMTPGEYRIHHAGGAA